jgi:hypothetical protein
MSEGIASMALLRDAERRAITAENPTGERGAGGRASEGTGAVAARDLGVGWKVSPSLMIPAGEEVELARITGSGVIDHCWMTTRVEAWRSLVLRMWWEDYDEAPAICVPLGDFFCQGWCQYSPLTSELIVVAPYGGLNSYFQMPFRRAAKISIENLADTDVVVYYQVDYTLCDVPAEAAYLHTHWRRSNPVPAGDVHTIVEGVNGRGMYVGTYLAFGANSPGWWGEGEIKFFLDDDDEYPTICGTGTEDYFGGAWNFDVPGAGYTPYCSNHLGLHQIIRPDGLYRSQTRFGMYRWHVRDPIYFRTGIRATLQDLGWRPDRRYLPRSDDVASVAYWYSDDPVGLPTTLALDALEVASYPERSY